MLPTHLVSSVLHFSDHEACEACVEKDGGTHTIITEIRSGEDRRAQARLLAVTRLVLPPKILLSSGIRIIQLEVFYCIFNNYHYPFPSYCIWRFKFEQPCVQDASKNNSSNVTRFSLHLIEHK